MPTNQMTQVSARKCTQCDIEKPLTPEFWVAKVKGSKEYRRACKDCTVANNRGYRARARQRGVSYTKVGNRARQDNFNARAKKLGLPGRVTLIDLNSITEKYPTCLCCGRGESLTIDHVIPMSKGGDNVVGNLQVLCFKCNSAKGDNSTDYRIPKSQRGRRHIEWIRLV